MDSPKRKTRSDSGETAVVKAKAPRTEEARLAKRESDRVRGKTRVNIGRAFEQWRQFREMNGFRSDPEMAFFLLDKVCGEHLSQDKSSTSPGKRGRQRKSTAAHDPQTEVSPQTSPDHQSDSEYESQSSPDAQTPSVEVLGISYDLSPLQPHQLDEAQPEQQTKDGSDLDFMIGSISPSCGSPSSSTEEDYAMYWDEIKDELAETTQRLQEHLDAMRSIPVGALEEPSKMREVKGLFRTCHQCGEPVLESKTLTSGSLVRIEWECSNGHLMWLFSNHNPT